MFVGISHQDFSGVCYHSTEAKPWVQFILGLSLINRSRKGHFL